LGRESLLFHEWRELMGAGFLSADGLRAIRGRLDGGEFMPVPI
jgi:hypothetical protein